MIRSDVSLQRRTRLRQHLFELGIGQVSSTEVLSPLNIRKGVVDAVGAQARLDFLRGGDGDFACAVAHGVFARWRAAVPRRPATCAVSSSRSRTVSEANRLTCWKT